MANTKSKKNINFSLIDTLVLSLFIAWEGILNILNFLGLAWWAKVETKGPDVVYWFGPFISKDRLEIKLKTFLKDISHENPILVDHALIKCTQNGPHTITKVS